MKEDVREETRIGGAAKMQELMIEVLINRKVHLRKEGPIFVNQFNNLQMFFFFFFSEYAPKLL